MIFVITFYFLIFVITFYLPKLPRCGSSALASQKCSRTQAAHDPSNERERRRLAFREMSEFFSPMTTGKRENMVRTPPVIKRYSQPFPRSLSRKKHQGRQSTPRGTYLNLLLDGLCDTLVSTDANATHLLRCLCASEQKVSGKASARPATAREA